MTVFGMVRVAAGRVFQLNVNLGVDADTNATGLASFAIGDSIL